MPNRTATALVGRHPSRILWIHPAPYRTVLAFGARSCHDFLEGLWLTPIAISSVAAMATSLLWLTVVVRAGFEPAISPV